MILLCDKTILTGTEQMGVDEGESEKGDWQHQKLIRASNHLLNLVLLKLICICFTPYAMLTFICKRYCFILNVLIIRAVLRQT